MITTAKAPIFNFRHSTGNVNLHIGTMPTGIVSSQAKIYFVAKTHTDSVTQPIVYYAGKLQTYNERTTSRLAEMHILFTSITITSDE